MILLVVEDDGDLRELLEMALSPEFEVYSCADGAEADRHLRAERVDAVLTDLDLPLVTGEEVLRLARSLRPAVPVIVMSGDPTRLCEVRDHADAAVAKPFTLDALRAAVRRGLMRQRPERPRAADPARPGRGSRTHAAAALAAAFLAAGCESLPSSPSNDPATLQDRWTLVSITKGSAAPTPAPPGAEYTATFGADGRLSLRADCNVCSGAYSAGAGTLAVAEPMACTLAYCQSAPFDGDYERLVAASTQWTVDGAFLELSSPGGRVRFRR
jgi:CheY-like chemotaxis protein/heat shock protein HslJ